MIAIRLLDKWVRWLYVGEQSVTVKNNFDAETVLMAKWFDASLKTVGLFVLALQRAFIEQALDLIDNGGTGRAGHTGIAVDNIAILVE